MLSHKGIVQSDRRRKLRHLHELIAALDRRMPQVERIGEIDIAREGRALREKALQRIAELQESLETSDTQRELPDRVLSDNTAVRRDGPLPSTG